MSRRRSLALALLAVAVPAALADAGALAFSRAEAVQRSATVDVVGAWPDAYVAYRPVTVRVPALFSFSNQAGLEVRNQVGATTKLTWAETSDPDNALDSVTQCGNVADGNTCSFRFSGNGLGVGTYTVTGTLYGDASPRHFNLTKTSIQITVEACAPC